MTIDYQTRLQTLLKSLNENNIDVGMITSPANVFYFTGFNSDPHERFMALIFDNLNKEFTLFVPALDKEIADTDSFVKNIIPISDEENPFAKLKRALGPNVKRIGLEMNVVSMFRHNQLQSYFPDASYDDIQPGINRQRLKKSRNEIVYLQQAVDIIEKVLAEGIKKVHAGMTEAELAAELEYLMKKFGAVGPSFSTMVLAGEKAALPHGTPGERAFKKGDFLLIDFGVITKEGYCSDITRTFIIGEASDKQKEIYNIVLQSNQAGITAVKAGVPLKTFDIEARNIINQNGYGEYFNNRVGHGLGIEVHEEPSIHENNDQLAEKGLLFTIEPGIYIPNYGGVRIEDEVYINEDGEAEVLTSFPRELQVL
ncbi:peptidase M24 family protein [Virgibacillus profundi]|uniref:Peptidase M24 family protein n=1 Tax=Virgibacillus profundi TaxID=2024555 RepID=A0A2A2IGH2_9BACI|nr:Xaa-Pro peptidase family protein [Virgibacillus profundi]PAV30468.1 peptidase M24 family protein [Virgibacillus profundi]PXY54640.1 aminopeptidase P family protein [Virgibacillus profundi]